jgi:alpha-glucosidase
MNHSFPAIKTGTLILVFVMMCFLLYLRPVFAAKDTQVIIKSPDGHVHLLIKTDNGVLKYSVMLNNATVIEPSSMGLVINGKRLGLNIMLGKTQTYAINETYATLGVHSIAVNHCNGIKVTVNSDGKSMSFILDARVFNDGVAFRYLVTSQGNAIIDKDSTQFSIPGGAMVWAQPNIKAYEGRYAKKNIADVKAGELAGPPLTIELAGKVGYAAITEGGLTDFAGMSLIANGTHGFTANLTDITKKSGDIESPWRIVEVGKDLNTMVNCDIVTNVSPAYDQSLFPQGVNTDWVKPGRSVWSWLAKTRSITLDNMKHFTDLAAQLGFEYNLVDEGWGNWRDSTRDKWDMMKELVDYSAKKGVKIWVWKAYPDRKGIQGINTAERRQAFFKRCSAIGIAGLKIDFFDSEAQDIVDFYQSALKDAAGYHLMMDFHGANKPTGENRTWPNELTREAIRGMENQPPWAPGNTALPFTRYLAGPADFTPVHFGNRLGEVSWAHQVATMVVFTSPLLCLGADPQSILDNPSKQMIQNIPPTWDETIVLPQSKIGELALYARRKGETWYLAALNGIDERRTVKVDLSFLKKGHHIFSIIKDDPKIQANAILENTKLSASQSIDIVMNATGGFLAKIDQEK